MSHLHHDMIGRHNLQSPKLASWFMALEIDRCVVLYSSRRILQAQALKDVGVVALLQDALAESLALTFVCYQDEVRF